MNVQHHLTLSCANAGFPAGRKACMDVGRAEKHLPRSLTGCQSSPKQCRVGTVGCREQTPPSWCLLARDVRPLCIVCHAGEAKAKTGEISVVQSTAGAPQPRQKLEIQLKAQHNGHPVPGEQLSPTPLLTPIPHFVSSPLESTYRTTCLTNPDPDRTQHHSKSPQQSQLSPSCLSKIASISHR